MLEARFSEEGIEVDGTQTHTHGISYFPIDNLLCKRKETSPAKKHKLTDIRSSKRNCSYYPFEYHVYEGDSASSNKKQKLTDGQSSESGFQSSSNHNQSSNFQSSGSDFQLSSNYNQSSESDSQSSDSDCSSQDKKHELIDDQLSENNCSSLEEKINSVDIQSPKSYPSFSAIENHSQFSKNCCFSSPVGKQNIVEVVSHESACSSPNRKHKLSYTQSSKESFTSPSNYHYKSSTHSRENNFSCYNKKYPLTSILLHKKTNCYSSPRKHKLTDPEFSEGDLSLHSCVKPRLFGKSFQNDLSLPSKESVSTDSSGIESFHKHNLPLLKDSSNESLYVLLKSANNCEKMLRQIIRTAYQFTRHSYREKLTLNDLEKAFKVHKVDIPPIDYNEKIGGSIPQAEEEFKPFICTGKWL